MNITLLCDHIFMHKPRTNRLLKLLESFGCFQLVVIHKCADSIESLGYDGSAHVYSFLPDKSSKERSEIEHKILQEHCARGEFEPLIYTPNRLRIESILDSLNTQDLLIVEDITLLPFARDYKRKTGAKILIDLREFYPLEYENDPQWLGGLGRLFAHLCEVYLPCVDVALSVSEGLCEAYGEKYGVKCELFYSLPPYFDFAPKPIDGGEIKILYHGFISPDRSSMELLSLARALQGSSYRIYAMVLSNQKGFLESFAFEADSIPTLELVPPVSLGEIIPASRAYDIGLIPFKPSTFNLAHCMPNKLFEYIQARLAIIATPLRDLGRFVKENACGKLTEGFESEDLARTLLELQKDEIRFYKSQAHRIAQDWHLERNAQRLKEIFCNYFGIQIK